MTQYVEEMSVLSICYKRQLNFLVTSADNLVTLVYPLPEIDPRLHPPQDAISGLRGANAVGSVINCHGNPAFVVELFSRENSEVCTTQPGQELQIMDEDICRICHDTKEKEELVRVCRCDGSARFAHRSCVLRWFQFSFRQECELCHYKMKIKKNGFKPLKEFNDANLSRFHLHPSGILEKSQQVNNKFPPGSRKDPVGFRQDHSTAS
ncbi:hypothetical protein pdam_00014811 [Pocillopora damicornis]|uniref:RING-CH-type domain-containing protein n=1 Tax=Pocillopora damicornis TaxID=46731 RepID=A0A3M6UKA6_POCDA|nr:hypothetical protein pdam_00014811 [Pocillopora damicornis]